MFHSSDKHTISIWSLQKKKLKFFKIKTNHTLCTVTRNHMFYKKLNSYKVISNLLNICYIKKSAKLVFTENFIG